jgi:hypothetical protein
MSIAHTISFIRSEIRDELKFIRDELKFIRESIDHQNDNLKKLCNIQQTFFIFVSEYLKDKK